MKFIPYTKLQIESEYEASEIKNILTNSVSKPDWNISANKFLNTDIIEGEIYDNSFVVCRGKFGLSYGRTSLLPIMKGKINENLHYNSLNRSVISVIIRPFKAGIVILSIFYLLCFFGLYVSLYKDLIQVFLVCIIFISLTYYSLMSKFNKEYKFYKHFLVHHLSRKRDDNQ
jgi:hypothetical protein